MWNTVWRVSFGVLIVSATAHAAPPAWCGGDFKNGFEVKDLEKFDGESPINQLRMAVEAQCTTDLRGDASAIPKVVGPWAKRAGMTDQDWADAVPYLANRYSTSTIWARKDDGLSSTWSPIDQWLELSNGPNYNTKQAIDPIYLADSLGDKLTQLGRAGFIKQCLLAKMPSMYATCQGDIDALDRSKAIEELRNDKSFDATTRMTVRLSLLELWNELDGYPKLQKAAQAKDPAYAKMWDIAATARAGWAKSVDPSLVELLHSMEDAYQLNSHKASDGCDAKTWAAFHNVVAAMPAKTFGDLSAGDGPFSEPIDQATELIVNTPNGYLASMAYYQCENIIEEHLDYLVRTLGSSLSAWPGYRGPRNAALTAIASAGLKLDERGAEIDFPKLARRVSPMTSGGGGGRGIIAKLATKGDMTTITFATERSKERQCAKGHSTNHIRAFDTAGDPVYTYICEKYTTVTIDEPPSDPITVPKRYAADLKKGMFVNIGETAVLMAYPKAGAPVPAVVAGVAVK